jgi:hypothetical protein
LKIGNIVAIRNGRSEVFNEKHRLELDRWGKITAETVKFEKNKILGTKN